MADYIERESISKLFDSECRGECVVCPHDDRGDCTLMNQIPAADVQPVKWIPVTERLPECEWGAEVGNIEWISFGRVYAGCFGRGGKYRDAYFRTWTDAREGIDAKEADYWRAVTLPEPPKDGEA